MQLIVCQGRGGVGELEALRRIRRAWELRCVWWFGGTFLGSFRPTSVRAGCCVSQPGFIYRRENDLHNARGA